MKNKKVKRSCKRIVGVTRKAEEAAEQRDVNKVYDTTRLLSGKRKVQSTSVKYKNGVVLNRTDDQFHRSKEDSQEIPGRRHAENPPDLTEDPHGIPTG